ncbi:hypothetical protein BV902_16385 [Sphingobacterium sp. B29]|nr:hypothetical protein BV902_16385 [Sphingobacterium sp. B29]
MFERGGGTHTIDGVAYEINGKQLHIVFPGQLHHWDIWAGTKSHTVFVSGRLFKHLRISLFIRLNIVKRIL